MGVLESMRSSSDSTFMQVLLVAIVFSFVGWMDGDAHRRQDHGGRTRQR